MVEPCLEGAGLFFLWAGEGGQLLLELRVSVCEGKECEG